MAATMAALLAARDRCPSYAASPAPHRCAALGTRELTAGSRGGRSVEARHGVRHLGGTLLLPLAVVAAAASCRGATRGAGRSWPRRPRARRRPRSARGAVAPGGAHCETVRRWVDEAVLGLGLCPWAAEADERAGIRIVASDATCEKSIYADLLAEVMRLPGSCADAVPSQPLTTLLVCPSVAAWSEFGFFHAYYAEELDGGCAFLEDYGVKLVAFHPGYTLASGSIAAGDELALESEDGSVLRGVVLTGSAGVDEFGEELFAVRLEDGEEYLLPRSAVAAVVGASDGEGQNMARNWASRSPQPVLHLLRIADLERADAEGAGEAVLRQNEECLRQLGHAGMESLLRRCG